MLSRSIHPKAMPTFAEESTKTIPQPVLINIMGRPPTLILPGEKMLDITRDRQRNRQMMVLDDGWFSKQDSVVQSGETGR